MVDNDIDYGIFKMQELDYGDIVRVKQGASGTRNLYGRVVYKDSKKVGVLIYKPNAPMTPLNALYTEYFTSTDVNDMLTYVEPGY